MQILPKLQAVKGDGGKRSSEKMLEEKRTKTDSSPNSFHQKKTDKKQLTQVRVSGFKTDNADFRTL